MEAAPLVEPDVGADKPVAAAPAQTEQGQGKPQAERCFAHLLEVKKFARLCLASMTCV